MAGAVCPWPRRRKDGEGTEALGQLLGTNCTTNVCVWAALHAQLQDKNPLSCPQFSILVPAFSMKASLLLVCSNAELRHSFHLSERVQCNLNLWATSQQLHLHAKTQLQHVATWGCHGS